MTNKYLEKIASLVKEAREVQPKPEDYWKHAPKRTLGAIAGYAGGAAGIVGSMATSNPVKGLRRSMLGMGSSIAGAISDVSAHGEVKKQLAKKYQVIKRDKA
jgi:hypothetical protein